MLRNEDDVGQGDIALDHVKRHMAEDPLQAEPIAADSRVASGKRVSQRVRAAPANDPDPGLQTAEDLLDTPGRRAARGGPGRALCPAPQCPRHSSSTDGSTSTTVRYGTQLLHFGVEDSEGAGPTRRNVRRRTTELGEPPCDAALRPLPLRCCRRAAVTGWRLPCISEYANPRHDPGSPWSAHPPPSPPASKPASVTRRPGFGTSTRHTVLRPGLPSSTVPPGGARTAALQRSLRAVTWLFWRM